MNFLRMLSEGNTLESNASTLFYTIWNDYVRVVLWILVAVLAVVLIVKGVTTALAVMKAADEPQVRQEKLGAFKYLAIGLGVAIVIIALANIIVPMILDNAMAEQLENKNNTSSWLF